MLLTWMQLIDFYTLQRALTGLAQDEFMWKPHAGAWGVVRRADCTTPSPGGAPGSEWVVDNDMDLMQAAYDEWRQGVPAEEAKSFAPMTTIGWLLNHFGAAPGWPPRSSSSADRWDPPASCTGECGATRSSGPLMRRLRGSEMAGRRSAQP